LDYRDEVEFSGRLPDDGPKRTDKRSMDTNLPIELKPIGVVRTEVSDDQIARRRRELVSTILVHPQYSPALDGLEEYSHLIVLFWMDRSPPLAQLRQTPHRDSAAGTKGAFALRTRNRPNPIGLAVVELIERLESSLLVRRLDAYDGTPVIDIKPYDHYDVYLDIRVPAWSNSAPRR